jgi:prepilin peptidase CpaA
VNALNWMTGGAVLVCGAATYWDLRERRIPNAVTLPALVLALSLHGATQAGQGLLLSMLGAVAAGALLIPGYLLRATGAGDVKLLMAVGAFLSWPSALLAGLLSLLVGGLLGVLTALFKGRLGVVFARTFGLARWMAMRASGAPVAKPGTSGLKVPFGVAIAVATVWVAFGGPWGGVR